MFSLVERAIQVIVTIITNKLPQAKVYLFGSRARGDHTPESDIDIAIDTGGKIDSSLLSQIKEEVEESTIPFTVDVVDLHTISDDFKKQILKDRKLCQ